MASEEETLELANKIGKMVIDHGRSFPNEDDRVDGMYSALFTAGISVLQSVFCRDHAQTEGQQLAYMSSLAALIHFSELSQHQHGQPNVASVVTNILYAGMSTEGLELEEDESILATVTAAVLARKMTKDGDAVAAARFMDKLMSRLAQEIAASSGPDHDLESMSPEGSA
jgi:hypothetical protein